MKQYIFFLILFLFKGFISFGQSSYTYMENNVRWEKNLTTTVIPTFTHYREKSFGNSSWGYTHYAYITQGWGEFLPGIYYKPTDKLLVAGYVGLESEDSYIRFGGYVSHTISDKLKYGVFAEHGIGKGNYWYDAQVWWKIKTIKKNTFYLVPRARREHGVGLLGSIQKSWSKDNETWSVYVTGGPFYHTVDKIWKPTVFAALEF